MGPLILVCIKLMGAAICGHWDLETQGLRETMTLLRGLLGGCQGQVLGGSRTKTSHSRQLFLRTSVSRLTNGENGLVDTA